MEPKIVYNEDCGNSPKTQLLKELNIAGANKNTNFITRHISETICCEVVGGEKIHGEKDVINTIKQADPIIQLEINNIITHGRTGAVNGTISTENNSYGFCHVYNFTGAGKTAKIKKITIYIIEE
ncbi:hypothetical protein GCM10009001_25060 [Virgibacillus siamensis]|uniref:DNA-binding protein n=1 Tax=Virgibacillus siamensis TaxID=480071 RepID=A0ABN1G9K4_9BACI